MNCLNLQNGEKFLQRIKCRACRLEKCISQGMNPHSVTCAATTSSNEKSPTPSVGSSHTPTQSDQPQPCPSTSSASLSQDLWLSSALELVKICDFYERILQARHIPINPYAFDLNIDSFLQKPSLLLQIDSNTASLLPALVVLPQLRRWSEMFALDIFLIAEYAKLLDHFKILIPNDQKSLLLCSAFAMVVAMQAFDSFHRGCDSITLPDGVSPILLLPQFNKLGVLSRYHREVFVEILAPLKRELVDKQEAALLLPMMLFQNVAFNLSPCASQACVPLASSYYMKLLFVYLRQKTDAQTASSRFASLISIMHNFFATAKKNCLHMLSENGNLSKVQDDLITQVILGHLPQELDFYGRDSRQQQTVSLSLPLQLPVRTL